MNAIGTAPVPRGTNLLLLRSDPRVSGSLSVFEALRTRS
jgi:hypothetical protein